MYLPAFDDEEKMALTKAIEALTIQESRVLALEEVEASECSMYLELHDEKDLNPFPVLLCVNGLSLIRFTNADGARFGFEKATYNKIWRCWSARPTDEQRKAVEWDE